ncbi:hypothetical protein [Ancylobacter pratisalsi]|uniref:Uncharacterized protein n=1 Tax=Ancylobacter pratisalsi TaxID=1745854 RepID=A0A6P1YJZ3_9HYPH|nr:hypothetical protein [Ancylobacter pratisalsi]QIB33435.1 hypothetical protein G3A50_06735 [Ancylobacter pratisalsi]
MAHASFAIAAPSRTTLASASSAAARKPGVFARFMQRVIDAQTRHVEAEMARYATPMAAALRGIERNG